MQPIKFITGNIKYLLTPVKDQIAKREMLYNSMIIMPTIVSKVKERTDLMIKNSDRYTAIAHHFINPIKWYHIACLHEMEAEQDFNSYLGNGQSLTKKTTIVPKGRGPFTSFESGAIDAIKENGLDKVKDWSIGNALYVLQGFNGFGYEKYHDMNTPYLWSGSNWYVKGKYDSDGHFNPNEISNQIGVAILLKTLLTNN